MSKLVPALVVMTIVCGAELAPAQVLQRPERPRSVADQARPWQTLTFSSSSLGGYDDNLTPGGATTLDTSNSKQAGYTGFGEMALQYRRGRASRSFDLGGRGYVNAYRNIGLTPSYGADVQARFTSALGRRLSAELSVDARTAPFHGIPGFAALRPDGLRATLPDANPANGFEVRRSRAGSGAASVAAAISRRDRLTIGYRHDRSDFRDDLGNTRMDAISLTYLRSIGRRSGMRASFSMADSTLAERTGSVPTRSVAGELGYELARQFSATRRLTLRFGGGGTRVETVSRLPLEPVEYTAPLGFGGLRFDWARTWSMSGDYRRAPLNLEGLTSESFMANAALVGVGGFATSRAELAFSGGFSEGRSGAGGAAAFTTYSLASQLAYRIVGDWSVVISHNFSSHRLSEVTALYDFPTHLERHAVRFGMSFKLPLIDATTQRPARTPAPRN